MKLPVALHAITFVTFVFFASAQTASAAPDLSSPEGYWTTIDDDTGKPKSIVRIQKTAKGHLEGHIVKVVDPTAPKHGLCEKCKGELKNKPLKGLRIMWDLELDDDEWDDGEILDPGNGSVYDCKIKVIEDGKKLRVRGYLGLSLFGRSQVWLRREAPAFMPATP